MEDRIKISKKLAVENILYILVIFLLVFPFCLLAGELSGPVSQTGQVRLYAIGDDGELRRGVPWPLPRFKDNGDGTVTDHVTSLIWMKNANCFGKQTWADAFVKVAGLNSSKEECTGYTNGTYTDWRVPNIQELSSLIDFSQYNPALSTDHPFISSLIDFSQYNPALSTFHPFIGIGDYYYYYWSSTTYAYSTSSAWLVYLDDGYVYYYGKTYSYYVWPVRGGQ